MIGWRFLPPVYPCLNQSLIKWTAGSSACGDREGHILYTHTHAHRCTQLVHNSDMCVIDPD